MRLRRCHVRRYRKMGVHTYEIWNEPNTARFWALAERSAAQYAELLAAAYPAVKAADPRPLCSRAGCRRTTIHISSVYAAGARGNFDAVGVHPYTGAVDPASRWMQGWHDDAGIRLLLRHRGDPQDDGRQRGCGQVGLADGVRVVDATGRYGVSETQQAAYLTAALDQVRRYPYVRAAFVYNGRDTASNPALYDDNLGLLRFDFGAKPAYAALRAWVAASRLRAATSKQVARFTARRRWSLDGSHALGGAPTGRATDEAIDGGGRAALPDAPATVPGQSGAEVRQRVLGKQAEHRCVHLLMAGQDQERLVALGLACDERRNGSDVLRPDPV